MSYPYEIDDGIITVSGRSPFTFDEVQTTVKAYSHDSRLDHHMGLLWNLSAVQFTTANLEVMQQLTRLDPERKGTDYKVAIVVRSAFHYAMAHLWAKAETPGRDFRVFIAPKDAITWLQTPPPVPEPR